MVYFCRKFTTLFYYITKKKGKEKRKKLFNKVTDNVINNKERINILSSPLFFRYQRLRKTFRLVEPSSTMYMPFRFLLSGDII